MTLMRAVQINEYGGAEQLSLNSVAVPQPGPDEVLVKIAYAGVNFMDVYTRRGVYKGASPYASELPLTLGMEGSGWVQAVGQEVTGFAAGDRVVFCLSRGSYAEYAVVAKVRLVLLPDWVTLESAATAYFQGLTAHYLAYDTSRLRAGDVCVVYSAAGGVAQNLISLLKHRQVEVIGVANTAEKCRVAKEAGASQVTLDVPHEILETVAKYTHDRGVNVLFDSVGRALYETSLRLLRKKGLFIHYGANSGPLGLIDPMQLANVGSIYFVRPRLNDHIGTRAELVERAYQLFDLWDTLKSSTVPSCIYELDGVSAAHQALETRQSIGKSILRIAQ